MPATFSAPGKLVLLGEYAVLFGAPAAVMAVDRRARVALGPAPTDSWTVEAPGLLEGPAVFELAADGSIRWPEPAQRLPLLDGVLGTGVATGLLDPRAMAPAFLQLDTRAFFAATRDGDVVKLGLGSSAALTTALTAALASWSGRRPLVFDRSRCLEHLIRLHRAVQGGRGSGIDVAAALHGGILSFRLEDDGRRAAVSRLELPPELELVYVWTGRSADTGSFLRRLAERMEHGGCAIRHLLDRLGSASATGIAAMIDRDVGSTLTAVEQTADALEALGRETGLSIFSPEHAALRELMGRHGASYKPSGAGGGDLGIAFAPDDRSAAAAAAAATEAGFSVVELAVDPIGLSSPPD